jgi:hypothetical protein
MFIFEAKEMHISMWHERGFHARLARKGLAFRRVQSCVCKGHFADEGVPLKVFLWAFCGNKTENEGRPFIKPWETRIKQ